MVRVAEREMLGSTQRFQLRIRMPVRDPEMGVEERVFIVIPREDVGTLVARVYADAALAAFHGRDRIYKLMATRFVGVNRNAVVDTIRRHEASQVRFRPAGPSMGLPGRFARRANHIWQLDFTDHRYDALNRLASVILVVVDCFSRYTWARYFTRTEYRGSHLTRHAKKDFVEALFYREGAPEVLQGDGEFGTLKPLCLEHGVRLRIGDAHHWQSQAVVERFNGLLQEKLHLSEADMDEKATADLVQKVVASMNHLPSRTLGGVSPFEAYRGRQPRYVTRHLDRHLNRYLDERNGDGSSDGGGRRRRRRRRRRWRQWGWRWRWR